MHAWIFQGVPDRYDLADKLQPGQRETWLVSRFRDEMREGDVVFFWRAGERRLRGFYGWGRISENAPRQYGEWGWGIEVTYEVRFEPFVSADRVIERGILDSHPLLTMPIGTNFRLTAEQYTRLVAFLRELRQAVPPAEGSGHE